MENIFARALKNEESNESISITENGALGYSKTNSRLVDFFFNVGSMRNMEPSCILSQFAETYAEDPKRAMELLFMVRDCRGGMGEKRTFKICFNWIIKTFPEIAIKTIPLIPEYGSWKSFFELTDSFRMNKDVESAATLFFKNKVLNDMNIIGETSNGSISLMGKWMPSENTSSSDTRRLARYWRTVLKMTPREYRKLLSKFRERINIVEAKMSAGLWSEINYNAVPAKAGIIYRDAFMNHDEARRRKWLEDLMIGKGNAKINTSGLSIPEMVSRYTSNFWGHVKEDPTIEAAWRDLVSKNMIPEDSPSMLPIMDGSGSMNARISDTSDIKALDVSIGLSLFLANINTPSWRGMVIEYGSNPVFFNVPTGASLLDQIRIALNHNDCGSTNIHAVYKLILETASKNHFAQKDIPELIQFSDMEFDNAMTRAFPNKVRLFQAISDEWNEKGYLLPKLVFWNINSRTGTIPLTRNEMGVSLLSGYNQGILQMVLSRKLDPLSVLLEKLDSPRYDPVRKCLA